MISAFNDISDEKSAPRSRQICPGRQKAVSAQSSTRFRDRSIASQVRRASVRIQRLGLEAKLESALEFRFGLTPVSGPQKDSDRQPPQPRLCPAASFWCLQAPV